MNNIVSYAQTFRDDFAAKPFTEVDSVILCQLAYLRYEHCGLPDRPGRTLQLGALMSLLENDSILENVPTKSMMRELMYAVSTSPRFRWLAATDYKSHIDAEIEKQFAAVTYRLEDGTLYVAFRGTDSTLIGWRENFNMALLPVIPSQDEGVAYLSAVAAAHEGPIIVGGHSKGGNLAVYAAANSPAAIQDRILAVYSHDGPGFHGDFFALDGYGRIRDRIHKTIPESAVIGLLLQHQEPYTVIESTEHGIFQHSMLTWVVKDGQFAVREGVNKGAQQFSESLNAWADSLDVDQRKLLVDTLFQVVEATNAQTLHDLFSSTVRNAPAVVRAISAIDPDTRQILSEKLTELATLMERTTKDSAQKEEAAEETP